MDRCSICDHSCRVVSPTGPTHADVLLIGEKPGVTEDKYGRVFQGDTGKELDNLYLPLAGLQRRDVRIVNCVRCRLGGTNAKPTPAQISACSSYWLPDEIATTSPSLIILLGSTACSLIPDIELDKQHGLPFYFDQPSPYFAGWKGWILPSYHPAAGLHQTSLMIQLMDDFARCGKWMRGNYEPPVDQIPTDYALINTVAELEHDFAGGSEYQYLPIDTESDGQVPWSLQYSLRPGHGRMVMMSNLPVISRFTSLMDGYGVMLHHSIADIAPLESIGLSMTGRPLRDTLQELYHIGNQPQGLKAAAFRLLGVRMRSWEDVVMPPSRLKMVEWLTSQWIESGEHKIVVEVQLKTKVKYLHKPSPLERALKRILSHSHKPQYDLWEKAKESELAGYPIPSIAHAKLADAITYSCADADLTGRLGTWLELERARIVQEEWAIDLGDQDV